MWGLTAPHIAKTLKLIVMAKATTTKKTTATKATTAKATTAKKTTAAKPAAKPAAKKVVVPKPTALSITGNKKIETLKKEFNKMFPYLSIRICYPAAKKDFERMGICYEVQNYKTIADVRRVDSKGDISIAGNKKIKTIEKEFEEMLGLFVKVCYQETEDCSYPIHGSSLEYTLSAYNALCEKRGCKKGVWK